jgi:hypothetical protein
MTSTTGVEIAKAGQDGDMFTDRFQREQHGRKSKVGTTIAGWVKIWRVDSIRYIEKAEAWHRLGGSSPVQGWDHRIQKGQCNRGSDTSQECPSRE